MLPDGRAGKISKEELVKGIDNFLIELWDEKNEMHLHHLLDLKRDIRKDVFRYEFNTFETKDDTISGEDFFKSVLSYQDPRIASQF